MDSLSLTSDDETNYLIERAYATFRETTEAPGYVETEYKPSPPPMYRQDRHSEAITSIDDAINRLDRIESYRHRLIDPPVDLAALRHAWAQYRDRYGSHHDKARNELPWDEMLGCELTMLQWHDVFGKLDKVVSKHEIIDPSTYQSTVRVPGELALALAKKVATNRRRALHQRRQAITYLRSKGVEYDALSPEERELFQACAQAESWPRTYL